jgi:hypothetical protein
VDGTVQTPEGSAAGDQHPALWAGGQQGAHLLGAGRIVEHDQQSPAGRQRAEQPGRLVQVGGNLPAVAAERTQEAAEHLQRIQRSESGGGAMEVGIELAVREGGVETVGQVDRQGRLPDPGRAVDRRDHDRPVLASRFEQRAEPFQLAVATGEDRHIEGELGGDGRRPLGIRLGTARPGQRGVGGEDRLMQALQLGAWLDAELLDEDSACVLVGLQRLGLTAGTIQRGHELPAQALTERELRHQPAQVADQVTVTAQRQLRFDPLLEGDLAALLEPLHRGLDRRRLGDVGQDGASPQPERRAHQPSGLVGGSLSYRRLCLGEQLLEAVEVQRTRRQLEPVPCRAGHEKVATWRRHVLPGLQRPAKFRHVALDDVARSRRRSFPPELVDQPIRRHHLIGVQEQDRQQRRGLGAPNAIRWSPFQTSSGPRIRNCIPPP